MKLYNSLSKKIELFKPIKSGEVSLYTCGPTVYDHVHIGNLRTYIFEDTLRRALIAEGYKVNHVMNITDIEDKIFKRSKENYPNELLSTSYKKLTGHFEKVFFDETQKVGIDLSNSKIIRATDAIADMQTLIRKIPNKYIEDDGIYFKIDEYPHYGRFTKLNRSHVHHRINNDEYDKEHVADFALWKQAKDDEPAWDFELNGRNVKGRPGWHIECSAMSTKFLGQPFDIHTGGVDLQFPHHENEVAQSKAAWGLDLANYWLHGEHLLVEGKKMSKSAKNFYTLEDIVTKGVNPLAFRLLVLQSHYRKQLSFSWNSLAAAQQFLTKIYELADRAFQPSYNTDFNPQPYINMIKTALNNDLDTPVAIAALAKMADEGSTKPLDTRELRTVLEQLDELFALGLTSRKDITEHEKTLLKERTEARAASDYNASDKLRGELAKLSIGINDTQFGSYWYRTT